MIRYTCRDCDTEFSEDDAYNRKSYHDAAEYCRYEGRPSCPECGSYDLDETEECEVCGEPANGKLCDTCRRKLEDILGYAMYRHEVSADDLWLMLEATTD